MRLIIIALVQLCLCTSVLYAQEYSLAGKVSNSETHKPIEYANVYLSSSVISYTKTDGSYSFEHLKPGIYNLCISCIGYKPYQQKIQIKTSHKIVNVSLVPSVELLSPIVVTGTGTRYRLDNVPVQTEIISGKSIQEISGRSVEEIISSLSSSVDFMPSSMGTDIKINGLGEDYVLILLDGKRLTGSVGGIVDLSRINSEDIEQIEIVKGASSTLYGSDAIAGVINIISKRPKGKYSISNSSRFGANNEWKQLNTFTYNKGNLSSKTSFSRKQNDGYQLNNMKINTKWESNHDLPYLVATYDMPVNKKRSYTINQSFVYDINANLKLSADASWYEKTLYFPFKGRMHNYYYNNKSASLAARYKLKNKDFINFSFDYGNYKYYNEYPYKYSERYITEDGVVKKTYYPGERFKNSDQTNLTFQLKGVFHLSKENTISSGLEYLGDDLEAKYRLINNDASAYTLSFYLQDEFKLSKKINFVGGVRVIHHDQFGVIATPKIAAMYKIGNFTHRISYANGFKSPTLKELYYFYESERMGVYRLYLGNKDLKPQKSNYYTISSEFKYKKFRTSLSLYINKLKDMIDYKIIPTIYDYKRRGIEETKFRYNINNAQNIGLDWTFNAFLFKNFTIAGGYSYVDARNKTQEVRLNGVSEHSATLKLTWLKNWSNYLLNVNLSGNYKSDKFYLEEEEERTYADPYQLWKLTTTLNIKKFKNCKFSINGGVDNIFDYVDDRPYGSHYGTLNPGRTIFIGLNFKFTKEDRDNKSNK